ncbi:acetylornithine deacetylase/succinyl-diaminopimelate desuccinylase family protein [Paracoccus denitrificans]|jgi:succinyl-diaminopimelate desuccinylase|uniref:Probable succinyl-diaminopimelate desuccinylase n=1 Tax=Paracoccus denitrificans (strain Pd 1222) TaxID=318586 RepID=A1B8W6_PARDP|nr:acetylornithine deacetylase/succinyl-diaminopimelate desuccinylase family protein [Paracoccus denitrificans]ABL71960.1 acetylornithine deacetylase or succinyl-diaminopimelate desuccinylase [Paracoccus denitrificans PD1222]MBB4626136.1 succinyl-diaminopimelate desuccinylase [Paracoccus denitrificans]MCU7430584.1 acetylornithine deacetylase/succinyl-diaminopimelate desuccinylase family protein [Paracoccus denitrificans]QAR28542.1 acetylornithine deacetylase/succinyl-diaminopimelate desuccinyla
MDALALEIENRRDDLIRLTQDLIRIPTLNPPGRNYREICEYLQARLAPRGWTCELIRAHGAPGDSEAFPRWNLVARHRGGPRGECVHFNSHHDVVEVGHGWSRDPFAAELDDGRIYGRGACDMKGGLAASIIAAEAFTALYPDHPGQIEISATADEESGGFGGVAYLAGQGAFAHVGHVIIPEPLHKDRICLGHRGVWWAEIETHGRIAHGSMPFLGDSAIRHMGAVLEEMERTLFPLLMTKRTQMPVIPEGARNSTLNINSIHGGEPDLGPDFTGLPAPCVADRCRIIIDRRFLIEEELSEVKREVAALLEKVKAQRPGFTYEIRDLFEVIPSMTDREAPVVRSTAAAIERVLGREAGYVVSPGTYDQKHIDRIGKLKNCIAYGPGVLDLAHQPDEWVGVQDMQDSARVMALVLDDILHGASGDSPGRPPVA